LIKPVRVIGPREPRNPDAINTTSSCKGLGKQFSPFLLGPVPLYKGAGISKSWTVENAWQYSKVYEVHLDSSGDPSKKYFEWAKEGWANPRAVRYPMGKGAKPEYSFWDGEKLSYIEARKKIYFPLYANSVRQTKAFQILKHEYQSGKEIVLWDYDGYDYLSMGMTLKDVLENPNRSMGHAFVIAALLEGTFIEKKR
jgi:hypothetical protein